MNIGVKIKVRAEEGAFLPEYKTAGAAGADVTAHISQNIVLKPLEKALVPTGLFFEIPDGYEIQVRPRSGLAFKNSITVLNTPGTIDSDYRGELKVLLVNLGKDDFEIKNGERIAQIIVAPVIRAEWENSASLSETVRGEGGFGSTGR